MMPRWAAIRPNNNCLNSYQSGHTVHRFRLIASCITMTSSIRSVTIEKLVRQWRHCWVTPGAATEGVTPLFFPEKPGDLFLVASSAVSPLISSSQKLTTIFAHRFIAFYCFHSGVTLPPRGCHPTPYLSDLVSPLFFVNLPTKQCFSFGCHPVEGVTWGGPPPSRPLVTPLRQTDGEAEWRVWRTSWMYCCFCRLTLQKMLFSALPSIWTATA